MKKKRQNWQNCELRIVLAIIDHWHQRLLKITPTSNIFKDYTPRGTGLGSAARKASLTCCFRAISNFHGDIHSDNWNMCIYIYLFMPQFFKFLVMQLCGISYDAPMCKHDGAAGRGVAKIYGSDSKTR